MGETLIELLFAFLDLFLNVLLEFAGEVLIDLLSRGAADAFGPHEPPHRVLTFLGCGFWGGLAGGASLLVFPHPLFHPSKIHGVSLIVSPVLTGLIMSGIGVMLRRRGKRVVQIESFPFAFAFAFGMALVRLRYVS